MIPVLTAGISTSPTWISSGQSTGGRLPLLFRNTLSFATVVTVPLSFESLPFPRFRGVPISVFIDDRVHRVFGQYQFRLNLFPAEPHVFQQQHGLL